MQRTLEQREKSLRWFIKNRWWFTCVFAFNAFVNLTTIFDQRSQLPHLFSSSLSNGLPVWHHIWVNIFNAALSPVIVALWWVRLHNYRREVLAAEQEALRKAAKPPEGVWPPPPIV